MASEQEITSCAASGCKNTRTDYSDLSFFRFPRDEERCKLWVTKCKRPDLEKYDPIFMYVNYRLCSEHFEVSAFMNPPLKFKLRCNAIPTLFLENADDISEEIVSCDPLSTHDCADQNEALTSSQTERDPLDQIEPLMASSQIEVDPLDQNEALKESSQTEVDPLDQNEPLMASSQTEVDPLELRFKDDNLKNVNIQHEVYVEDIKCMPVKAEQVMIPPESDVSASNLRRSSRKGNENSKYTKFKNKNKNDVQCLTQRVNSIKQIQTKKPITQEQIEEYRVMARERQRLRLLLETPEERERRLEKIRTRQVEHRQDMIPQEQEQHLAKARERTRNRLAKETPEQSKICIVKVKDFQSRCRKSISSEQMEEHRNKRNDLNSVEMANIYEKEQRRIIDRERKRFKRLTETPEQREQRLAKRRERARMYRSQLTLEQKEEYLARRRERKRFSKVTFENSNLQNDLDNDDSHITSTLENSNLQNDLDNDDSHITSEESDNSSQSFRGHSLFGNLLECNLQDNEHSRNINDNEKLNKKDNFLENV